MVLTAEELEKEKQEILKRYRGLLRVAEHVKSKEDKAKVKKAFQVAVEAHKEMRRKSGEPYIYHPIAVARIVVEEIGLGTTGVVCALLHDTVEDTYITLKDIEVMFGKKEAKIIDGLTKISGFFDLNVSAQAENFRKMLLTLSDDVRVILIKIADRLHNMRTLESMRPDKQIKIASETLYLFAPLAHRLGLYSIKSELEDLSLKYLEAEKYQDIQRKLNKTQDVRNRFIRKFTLPIRRSLEEMNLNFEVKGRTKSVFSIFQKIHKKNIPFEEIYDLFAIRIIIDTPENQEKADCWKVYSVVTDFYQPNPDRLRDWISTPKSNGYESLHTTVMSPTGKWVEVQIRTVRMDEIAEKGYAAHWKYKGGSTKQMIESGLDAWVAQVRELLENPDVNALDFVDNFKLNLYTKEIYVFTPNGDLKNMPVDSTALDFAYSIHTGVGDKCVGAHVNSKLVPMSYKLKNGDQVEILTAKSQKPKEDWLKIAVTAKAKQAIRSSIKEEKKSIALDGKERLQRKLASINAVFDAKNLKILEDYYGVETTLDLYYGVAIEKFNLKKLKGFTVKEGIISFEKEEAPPPKKESSFLEEFMQTQKQSKDDTLVLGEHLKGVDYKLAPCCNPIPGDDVFGFVTINDGIKIHRITCPNATQMLSNYAYRVVKAKWKSQVENQYLAGIKFTGIDDIGLVNKITESISKQLSVNMKSISFDSGDGIFTGEILLYIHDREHLQKLISRLRAIDGVKRVERIEV
jgi:guanosine-3',5'-bis(diphosphate) 3'-pyrophosphohydrolase